MKKRYTVAIVLHENAIVPEGTVVEETKNGTAKVKIDVDDVICDSTVQMLTMRDGKISYCLMLKSVISFAIKDHEFNDTDV